MARAAERRRNVMNPIYKPKGAAAEYGDYAVKRQQFVRNAKRFFKEDHTLSFAMNAEKRD